MTEQQYLLTVLIEECAEVAQRATKALRFGPLECEPGQELNNEARLQMEIEDLLGSIELLNRSGMAVTCSNDLCGPGMHRKMMKVDKYMQYSRELGILAEETI